MPRPAATLTNAIINYLYRQGVFAWRSSSTGIYDPQARRFRTAPKRGVSDVLAVRPPTGQLLAIEVKIGKDKLSPEQRGFLHTVEQMGGATFIAKDFESFKVWYSNLIENKDDAHDA